MVQLLFGNSDDVVDAECLCEEVREDVTNTFHLVRPITLFDVHDKLVSNLCVLSLNHQVLSDVALDRLERHLSRKDLREHLRDNNRAVLEVEVAQQERRKPV